MFGTPRPNFGGTLHVEGYRVHWILPAEGFEGLVAWQLAVHMNRALLGLRKCANVLSDGTIAAFLSCCWNSCNKTKFV